MTAAIAEVPQKRSRAARKSSAECAGTKPTQYPTQDVPVHLIVRSETNRVPEVDDDFIESIRRRQLTGMLRPIKATQEHTEAWT